MTSKMNVNAWDAMIAEVNDKIMDYFDTLVESDETFDKPLITLVNIANRISAFSGDTFMDFTEDKESVVNSGVDSLVASIALGDMFTQLHLIQIVNECTDNCCGNLKDLLQVTDDEANAAKEKIEAFVADETKYRSCLSTGDWKMLIEYDGFWDLCVSTGNVIQDMICIEMHKLNKFTDDELCDIMNKYTIRKHAKYARDELGIDIKSYIFELIDLTTSGVEYVECSSRRYKEHEAINETVLNLVMIEMAEML